MDVKNNILKMWSYLSDAFEMEEIEAAFENAIEGYDFNKENMTPEIINALPDEEAKALFFDMGYAALNELFGGDWDTWGEVLQYSLEFDENTMRFLDF